MKRPISPAYTFNPGAATLNLSGIANFSLANLFAIIDLRTGAVIYAPLAGYAVSALSGTTLTLQAPMTGLAAADPLMILYDDGGKPAEDASVQAVTAAIGTLAGDVASNHSDLATLHADVGTTLHADLQAILADLDNGLTNDGQALAALTATTTWQGNVLADLGAILAKIPGLGQAPSAGSLPVVLASDGAFVTTVGAQLDAAATADAGSFSLIALVKRGLARWTTLLNGLPASLGVKASAAAFPVVLASDQAAVPVTPGRAATAGDSSVTAGGTAQTLFAGTTPANGWKVANPDGAEDLWVSDSTTAAPNGLGCYRVPAGGVLTTEPLERPCGPVSVYGATTGHVITARAW